jgi:signal transduction histidine kinase
MKIPTSPKLWMGALLLLGLQCVLTLGWAYGLTQDAVQGPAGSAEVLLMGVVLSSALALLLALFLAYAALCEKRLQPAAVPQQNALATRALLASQRVSNAQLVQANALLRATAANRTLHFAQALQDKNVELHLARVEADKAKQAKADFLSSMSHELRSPLNAILGFAQLLESAVPGPTAVQKASLDQVLRAGWYLLDLINDVLDLSLIESGKLSLSIEPMLLSELLEDCHTLMQPLADKRHITLYFPPPSGARCVRGDRTRVKQVLINLLSNAIQYNREGGAVHVSCTDMANACLRIAVQDTGEGLPPEKMAQLFQPFHRLGEEADAGEGTGIGLVVSKRLLELMGGEIGMRSQVGVGSVFWIELAVSDAVPQPLAATAELPAPVGTLKERLSMRTQLDREDTRANRNLVEQLVAHRTRNRVAAAGDGQRADAPTSPQLPAPLEIDSHG